MFDDQAPASALETFYADEWITEVIQVLKSGKEATAYLCAAHPSRGLDLLAVKVYRPLETRGFRNDSIYQEERFSAHRAGDKRLQRAFANKSRKGREVQFHSWCAHEYETLTTLHAAGADVPRPYAATSDAIAMEYVGDVDEPAPLLQNVSIDLDEARPLFERLIRNVELWLAHDRVHGDLSAYNVLYWQGRAVVIDFPQAVDARFNSHARDLLTRDVANLCRCFARYGVVANAEGITNRLWRQFLRGELSTEPGWRGGDVALSGSGRRYGGDR